MSSHKTQLAATAVLSGAAVAGAIFGYQAYKRQEAVSELKDSIPDINEQHHAEKVISAPLCNAQQSMSANGRI